MVLSKEICKVLSYESFVHAVSGATGSVVAMSVFYPVDTVRARLQVEEPEKREKSGTFSVLNEIFKYEGISSLYRGLVPVLQSLCLSNFVYFYTFHSLKAMQGRGNGNQSAFKDLLLGSIAGMVNVMLTTPFWVVNTRLKMNGVAGKPVEKFNNLLDGLIFIGKTEGFKGLWAGAIPSLMLVINPALQFMFYESIKRRLTKIHANVHTTSFFFLGALAKAFATFVTYPLQLVQTKLRTCDRSLKQDASTTKILFEIARKYGFKGLYRGIEAKIWQTILTAALMFATYEKIALIVGKALFTKSRTKV
ncbi:peroxisomal membrane protein PMP34 [Condylostylus longicornis]|uniref:peroxisomal membrane protein PMP34 n=1 Tax=Condylostylus longicornis TaxID=2530218 RepID=UPI00244DED62|nr:peroxisomal membrane protein PMP34 [Condylostylus longicornis]